MKIMKRAFLVGSLLLANSLSATPVPLQNASFESPTGNSPNGLFDSPDGAIGAWSYTRSGVLPQTLTNVAFVPSLLATDGSNVADLSFVVAAVGGLSLYQDTGVSWLPDTIYTLTFDADQLSTVSLLSGASVSLMGGALPVASLSDASLLGLLDGAGVLNEVSFSFLTGSVAPTGNLGVRFTIGGIADVLGAGLVVDNVRLDATPNPVPEPSTAFLAGLAALQLFKRRRGRWSSNSGSLWLCQA